MTELPSRNETADTIYKPSRAPKGTRFCPRFTDKIALRSFRLPRKACRAFKFTSLSEPCGRSARAPALSFALGCGLGHPVTPLDLHRAVVDGRQHSGGVARHHHVDNHGNAFGRQ